MKKLLFFTYLAIAVLFSYSQQPGRQEISLIPQPVSIITGQPVLFRCLLI